MEKIVKANLNKATNSQVVTKETLHQQIMDSEAVNEVYLVILNDTDDDNTNYFLLNRLVKCWVHLRLKAFSNVYMYIKKNQEKNLSCKSQKSMRRELNKENV